MRPYELVLLSCLLVTVRAAIAQNGAWHRAELTESVPRTGIVVMTEVLKTDNKEGIGRREGNRVLGRSLKIQGDSDDDSDDDKDDDDDDSDDDNDDSDDDNDDSC